VILVAFAIQFGSVGAGITASVNASPDCLRLCEGGLLPMLWADAALCGGAVASTGPAAVSAAGDVAAVSRVPLVAAEFPVARPVSPVQLPIPPPVGV
jgi:hypothetical protein